MVARVVSGSKTGMIFEGARAAETALIKNYKGLNKKNAQELIKAFSNKESSIRILQNIANKADSSQKPLVNQAIFDILPAIIGGKVGGSTTGSNEAQAAEPTNQDLEQLGNRYKQSESITHYNPSQEELKRISGNNTRNRYKESSGTTHYIPDEQELKRITQ